ncbi:MAG TPA: beta-lactamase family protein [Candidatus Eisenbergiella merdipullorum]|uniref:Beta-lactamase family protein n=1 Tax=Candidatus Eisenbergiella merdipullorum TaxID=2838553 RepID=A0A9D2I3Y3_9FIRM|nr:beta-lactamase family protein [Candidatus Eisenbergiella merdipullorum]
MDFVKLGNYIDCLESTYHIPAAAITVYHNDRCVFRHFAGYADAAGTRPMKGTSQFFLYSASKVITCTAAMILMEEGKLSLMDEAGKFYPAFARMKVKAENGLREAKNKLTVLSLLTMTGGLSYEMDAEPLLQFRNQKHHENIMEDAMNAIAQIPLDFEPSTHYQYSLCHDVIGGIIEKASGIRLGEYLQSRIFEPLGMQYTRFGFDETQNPNFLEQYSYKDENGCKISRAIPKICGFSMIPGYESGGGGLVSCLDDYGKFVGMLAAGGVTADGKRILSEQSIDRMRTPSLSPVCEKEFIRWDQGYSYGLGVRTMVDREKKHAKSPIGEFGWDGAAGAFNFIDTKNDLAMFYAQHVLDCSPAFDVIHPTLRDLTYECFFS